MLTDDRQSLETLLTKFGIEEEDLNLIHSQEDAADAGLDAFIEKFYFWLEKQPEYEEFFNDEQVLQRVKSESRNYWVEFFTHPLNEEYLTKRRAVGEVHARIGLPMGIYLAAMNCALSIICDDVIVEPDADKRSRLIVAVTKLIHLDTSLVIEMYNMMVSRQLTAQTRSLMEMSTPVTQIWDGVLFLPIVGIVDSKRAQDIMDAALGKISETQCGVFIMDISGVAVIDTAVANHLINVTKATRLMGCECLISGVSPSIAQTIVELGIDVGNVRTLATMQDALKCALHSLRIAVSAEA
jgi:rsbT co-antagonist protein RsbR